MKNILVCTYPIFAGLLVLTIGCGATTEREEELALRSQPTEVTVTHEAFALKGGDDRPPVTEAADSADVRDDEASDGTSEFQCDKRGERGGSCICVGKRDCEDLDNSNLCTANGKVCIVIAGQQYCVCERY